MTRRGQIWMMALAINFSIWAMLAFGEYMAFYWAGWL